MSQFDIDATRAIVKQGRGLARANSAAVGPGLEELYASFCGLPGLRGLWYPGVADNTGAVYDASGQGRTLTYNGNPTINLHNSLIPYFALDGTGDFHSRADENGLRIAGNETIIASAYRGLTLGGWFWSNSLGSRHTLISKTTGLAGTTNYWLEKNSDDKAYFWVGDGANLFNVTSAVLAANTWYHILARYTPSTELKVVVNGVATVNTTTIPATVVNSAAPFNIGSLNSGTNLLTGRWALGFLCGAALPDDLLTYLFHRTQPIFGV